MPKRVSVQQQGETVKRGKSGTLQRKQPEPEVFLDDKPVREAREKSLRGKPFFAGDTGTEIILSELRRKAQQRDDVTDDDVLGATQQLAQEAGLEGFKAKGTTLGRIIGSKTFGVPNVLLAVASLGVGNLSSASAAGTQAGGTAVPTAGGGGFIGPPVEGLTLSPSSAVGAAPASTTTAGGSGFIGKPVKGLNVIPGSPASGTVSTAAAGRGAVQAARNVGIKPSGVSGGSSATKVARTAFRGARLLQQLGDGGGTTGSSAALGSTTPQQLIFQAPAQRTVQRRSSARTVAGAQPAGLRNLRDKFGGTATASLFARRQDRFGARTRQARLGGR